ncbi:UNVERIFIED_CONTAM: hypothetical protein K2H54_065689 [Gekko kuhli]
MLQPTKLLLQPPNAAATATVPTDAGLHIAAAADMASSAAIVTDAEIATAGGHGPAKAPELWSLSHCHPPMPKCHKCCRCQAKGLRRDMALGRCNEDFGVFPSAK